MPGASREHTFYYNAPVGHEIKEGGVALSYRNENGPANVNFKLPRFVGTLGFVTARYLDLLEIASYVYCADRLVSRGPKNSPYFTGWRRQLRHIVFVRDYEFWSDPSVIKLLDSLLSYLSGDLHHFQFHPGHSTPKAHMFDGEQFWPTPTDSCHVALFSGGLDSTSGAYDILAHSSDKLCLTSHISSPGMKKTLDTLLNDLERCFPKRVHHIMFGCNLRGDRAREETQRTRSFLYAAVAAAAARRYRQDKILLFENGVLSINLPPSEQYQNARTTRTTHPKTLYYLSQLLSMIEEKTIQVENPFFWKTKTDILELLKNNNGIDIISSTVSCSRLFDKGVRHLKTHCGRCSQCIDRRFAFAAAKMLDDENLGLYAYDFVTDNICPDNDSEFDREERTMLVDYVRLAIDLNQSSLDRFCDKWLDELTDVVDFIEGFSEEDKLIKLYEMFSRHGNQVMNAILEFQRNYSDVILGSKPNVNSLSDILSTREYLEKPQKIVAMKIGGLLSRSIPIAFQYNKPKDEKELQGYIESLLCDHSIEIRREFPHIRFGIGDSIPDFSSTSPRVFIEVKYLRGKSSPSKANKDIAEDCTKYPNSAFLLFVIYDPERKIRDDLQFSADFTAKRECFFCIVR